MPVPKVKNGPNKDQERARNQAGGYGKPPQWRAKRNDTGKPRGNHRAEDKDKS